MRCSKSRSAAKSVFAIFLTLLLASTLASHPAQAKKFKVLHTFKGSDGAGPDAQLVRDSAGNFYGTTGTGGSNKCQGGCGTAFKMDKNGNILWLHRFSGANGETPFPGLLRDATGNLYGTTIYGGRASHTCSLGCGVVFKLGKNGEETVLHHFTGEHDGYYPVGPLAMDKKRNLYGATQLGGTSGVGTVFRLSPSGEKKILYSFTGGADGYAPGAGVVLDAQDNVYGTTLIGGSGFGNSGYGVVFQVSPGGVETVLHTFGGDEGANPGSSLIFDSTGNLFGTTQTGGELTCDGGEGCGVLFELSPQSGGTWGESVLYTFCSLANCTDGRQPREGPLVQDAAGSFYGTTAEGGSYSCNGSGCGVVFKLDADGTETVLHSFTGGSDGDAPLTGVMADGMNNLYGVVVDGGDPNCPVSGGNGCGTVWKLTP